MKFLSSISNKEIFFLVYHVSNRIRKKKKPKNKKDMLKQASKIGMEPSELVGSESCDIRSNKSFEERKTETIIRRIFQTLNHLESLLILFILSLNSLAN